MSVGIVLFQLAMLGIQLVALLISLVGMKRAYGDMVRAKENYEEALREHEIRRIDGNG